MPRRAASLRLLLIGAAVLALVLPPLFLRAEPANWSAVRSEVAALPQADRDRLNRNTSEYLQLSEAERQRYRDLHDALKDDAQNSRGQLQQTLNDYTAWLGTNHAYDRQLLLTTTDPQLRVAEIQRIVDERNEALSRSRGWRSGIWMRFGVPDLTADELVPVMSIVEGRLALGPDDREKLRDEQGQDKTGLSRYFALFRILRDHGRYLNQILDQSPDELLAAIPESKRPADLEKLPVDRRPFVCLAMIAGNVLQEYEQEVRRRAPTDEDLQQIVEQWPRDKQRELDALLELDPADFRRELERFYARDRLGLDVDEVSQVLPSWRDLPFRGRFGGRDRGQPPERPGDGPDGDRGSRRFPRGGPDGERRFFPPDGPPDGRGPDAGRGPDERRGPRGPDDPPRRDGQPGPPPGGERGGNPPPPPP